TQVHDGRISRFRPGNIRCRPATNMAEALHGHGRLAMTDWDRMVREQAPRVFGTAWRILGHAADAEDVVQEVFLQVHQLRQKEEVRSWGAFLRRLAACRALDRLRQRRLTVNLDGLELATGPDGPEELAMERELRDRLREALGQLPAREAEVFCLRYFEDLSY